MKKFKMLKYILFVLVFICAFSISVSAQVWVFGSSGQGQNPFTAKGYAIKTESGKIQWLYSKFDNGGYDENGNMHMQDGGTVYTGTDNGVQYINATKADKTTYQLYAFTNRNPLIYNFMFAYKKQSQNGEPAQIKDFTSRLGSPIRTGADLTQFPNGINQQWAIPINNFVFEPGTLYDFGFQQGMQANNGISMVLQDDNSGHYYGYLMNPYTASEQALYDKMKLVEYQFISSYKKVDGTNYFNVNFVPMRFSVQTYADLSAWNTAKTKVQSFTNGVTQGDYDSGRFSKASIENLKTELNSMQSEADNEVKKQLKVEADANITKMVNKITADMNLAKTETGKFSDTAKLDAELKTANDFYDSAKTNVGTAVGNYKKETVDALKKAIDTASELAKEDLQSDINKAVTDLENAVIQVKSSQIQPDKITLSDFVSGIQVTVSHGSVPENASLIVTKVNSADQRYNTIKNSFGDAVKGIEIYYVLLYSGDQKIQPSQPITIQFPVPDSMKNNDISVYLSGNDLNPEKISSVRSQNFVVTNSNSVGYFSLVSLGDTVTVLNSTPQTDTPSANNPANNPKGISGLPSITQKVTKGKVNVIKQTDLSTKDKPDEKQKSLDITAGAGNSAMSVTLNGKSRGPEKIADLIIPQSEILQKSNPFLLLLFAAILGVIGLVYGGILCSRKIKESKPPK